MHIRMKMYKTPPGGVRVHEPRLYNKHPWLQMERVQRLQSAPMCSFVSRIFLVSKHHLFYQKQNGYGEAGSLYVVGNVCNGAYQLLIYMVIPFLLLF